MLHPDTELRFIDDRIGYGVFATRRIRRGTITWARDPLDRVIGPEEFRALPPVARRHVQKYGYVERTGSWVLCWDLAKYVNHSCEPSCLSPGYEFEIAVRDILPGEEVTDDYGSLNLDRPMACLCGAPGCRGRIRPDDFLSKAEEWDRLIREAFQEIKHVPQPLWPVIREKRQIDRVLGNGGSIRSIRYHGLDGRSSLLAGRAGSQQGNHGRQV